MLETLTVFAAVGLLAGAGLVLPLVPPELVLGVGFALIGVGMLLGVPTGFWYHVRLRAALVRQGTLPERWWVHPAALHARVAGVDLPGVVRCFVAGAVGFVLSVAGCLVVVLGVALQAFHARALLFG